MELPVASRFSPPAIPNKVGIYEYRKGIWIEVLEEHSFKKHSHFKGSCPPSSGIEEGFDTGPVYVVYADDCYVDVGAGVTLVDQRPLRQTTVVQKLVDRYTTPSPQQFEAAQLIDADCILLPVASQRMRNYCRWWMDSVAKLFISSRSNLLRSNLRASTLQAVVPKLASTFQRQTVSQINWHPDILQNKHGGLARGRSINTSGLTFGGGQRIGSIVRDFSCALEQLFPASKPSSRGELLFVSRNEASFRRILNEEELLSDLRELGFEILHPASLPLQDQIAAFRNARVVVSAHGAGLTNILFCRPGTTLIEIFPEGGVHGSAFFRMASHLGFDYFFVTGEKVENEAGKSNDKNFDLRLEKDSFFGFLKEVLSPAMRR